MTADERRRFDMLVRVRDFGTTHAAQLAASPAAVQTLAVLNDTIEELTETRMKKTTASSGARSDRRVALRRDLRILLRRAARLARNLEADGRAAPTLWLPPSRNDTALLTTAADFGERIALHEAEFSAHHLSSARVLAAREALDAAIGDQIGNRLRYVGSRVGIGLLLAKASRAAQRLDLILADDIERDAGMQAAWKQLRRLEPRRTRTAAEPAAADAA
jgi:hypothetical protein